MVQLRNMPFISLSFTSHSDEAPHATGLRLRESARPGHCRGSPSRTHPAVPQGAAERLDHRLVLTEQPVHDQADVLIVIAQHQHVLALGWLSAKPEAVAQPHGTAAPDHAG